MTAVFNKKTAMAIIGHALVWAALIVIGYTIARRYDVPINWGESVTSWGLYILLFYVNYLLLIPRLLFRKHVVLYVVAAVGLTVAVFVSARYTSVKFMDARAKALREELTQYADIEQRNLEREREERLRRAKRVVDMADMSSEQRDSIENRSRMFDRRDEERNLTPREEKYEALYREQRRQRNFFRSMREGVYNPVSMHNIPLVYTLLFFYMASIALAYIERYRKTERHRLQMESEKISAELAYLKQQINPHFLFNTLNSIYYYTIGVSTPASDAVLKLSSILRYMLYEANRDRVPLSDEIAIVYDYIDLQRLRITDKTKVEITITGDTPSRMIEPMLLIPILENAFKYGIDSVEESFVKIEIDVDLEGMFTFRVSNKVVKKNSESNQNSGIGIKNIHRRLDLIYKGDYTFLAEETNGIFFVTLRLRLH